MAGFFRLFTGHIIGQRHGLTSTFSKALLVLSIAGKRENLRRGKIYRSPMFNAPFAPFLTPLMTAQYASNEQFIDYMRNAGIPVTGARVAGTERVFVVDGRTLRLPMDTPAPLCPQLARIQLSRQDGQNPSQK